VSSTSVDFLRNCKRCGHELAPGALACGDCHTLVHAEELERLSAQAKSLEEKGELRQACEQWLSCAPLLPQTSKQAEWVKQHVRALSAQVGSAGVPQMQAPEPENKWGRKLAPLGPVAVLLAKGKMLLAVVFKLNFLLSLVAFIGVYWALYGPRFGIGFALLILLHEMGHYVDIKRRGLPAEMPVFLPGLGAYVRWRALGVSVQTRAAISLAGPLAGWIGSVVCALVWWKTGNGLWAALARASAWLNALNLIPVWIFDGGQAALALTKLERVVLVTVGLLLWAMLGEKIFLLVAAGAAWRVFTKDAAAKPSVAITAYFVALLTVLGIVMRILPGQGAGMR
jgi:Zn-dependent protease